jgi:hypothetical protein
MKMMPSISPFFIVSLCIFLLFFLLIDNAQAAVGAGGALPYETWLVNLRNSVTGPGCFYPIYCRHCRCRRHSDLWWRTQCIFPHLDFYRAGYGVTRGGQQHHDQSIPGRGHSG